MPLTSSDIQYRYSNVVATGGDNDSAIPPTRNLVAYCIGKFISTVPWVGGVRNDLFDNITGAQNVSNRSDYRCIFVANTHPSLTLFNAQVYIPSQIAGGATVSISPEYSTTTAGRVRVVPTSTNNPQAIVLTNATAAPSDLTAGWTTLFSPAEGLDFALLLGDLPPGQCCPIWIKRQAQNTSALDSDAFTIRVQGDNPQ